MPIDRVIGENMRQRREALGRSQQALGAAIGVTFQQVQKYENGKNSISASRLQAIARELNTEPAALMGSERSRAADIASIITSTDRESLRLLRAFARLKTRELKISFVLLAEAIATKPH